MTNSMTRRKSLTTLADGLILGLGGAAASSAGAQTRPGAGLVMDDGVSEITPVYVMTYTDGNPTVFVRSNFYFWDAKKQVQMGERGSIKVNGIALAADPKDAGSYIGDIPVGQVLTFEFIRPSSEVLVHDFELPDFHVADLPRQYDGIDPLVAGIRSHAARKGVMEDTYAMTIYGRTGESRFRGERVTPTHVSFRSVQYSPSPPGTYRARIFRQQRTPLKDISTQRLGWAVATRGHNFVIEVTGG